MITIQSRELLVSGGRSSQTCLVSESLSMTSHQHTEEYCLPYHQSTPFLLVGKNDITGFVPTRLAKSSAYIGRIGEANCLLSNNFLWNDV